MRIVAHIYIRAVARAAVSAAMNTAIHGGVSTTGLGAQ